MTAALLLASLGLGAGPVTIGYDQFGGLSVDVLGFRLVSGSAFQYFEKGWQGGIYSSRWQPKTVVRTDDRITVRYMGRDTDVLGTIVYALKGNELSIDYDFGWNGGREVTIENCFGLLWAPAFKDATAESSGLRRSRFEDVPMPEEGIGARALTVDTRSISFVAPFGRLQIESEVPFTVFDARNYPQEWARGRPVHWAGAFEHAIKPGGHVSYSVRITLSQLLDGQPSTETVAGLAARLERAQVPQDPPPLLPTPKNMVLRDGTIRTSGRFAFDSPQVPAVVRALEWLNSAVSEKWEVSEGPPTLVTAQVNDAGGEAYSLGTQSGRVSVIAGSEAGIVHALTRLAQLVRSDGEGLVVPDFRITNDRPIIAWRGVHMFVGPSALDFQSRLMDRMLVPLRFNHAVLQCERTDWESQPSIKTKATMSKADLKALFDRYRLRGIEPVPLIQSLGHMEWLFANGQNRNLAVDPAQPYVLDARKQEARDAIGEVWEEAFALLNPKAVHFGLDETDRRGMHDDPHFATRLWNVQVPFLLGIARGHGAEAMFWGDMMLAPEEANDAAHAPDATAAAQRRELLPKGTMVADWHYENSLDPKRFKSLELWRSLGMRPVAAGWYRPDNVFGLTKAAQEAGAGYLQTTWAGYESSEKAMTRELHQLAGYVLAADYAWGAQMATPNKLPYDPIEVARRLLFDERQPAGPQDGLSLLVNQGPETQIGGYTFRGRNLFELRSTISARSSASPSGIVASVSRSARRVAVAVDCFAWMDVGQEVATIIVHLNDGEKVERRLVYGIDVRAEDDPSPTASPRKGSVSVVAIDMGDEPKLVRSIEFQRAHPVAGLRVHGITLV